MPAPRFEVANGAIDGSNTAFTVSIPYTPGSTAVFLNGQLQRADYASGWLETSPGTGQITMKEAPLTNDVIQVFFLDTATESEVVEILPISGRIRDVERLQGRFAVEDVLHGKIR